MCGPRGGQTDGHVWQLIGMSFATFYWKCARNVFQVLSPELQTKITGCHTHVELKYIQRQVLEYICFGQEFWTRAENMAEGSAPCRSQ